MAIIRNKKNAEEETGGVNCAVPKFPATVPNGISHWLKWQHVHTGTIEVEYDCGKECEVT